MNKTNYKDVARLLDNVELIRFVKRDRKLIYQLVTQMKESIDELDYIASRDALDYAIEMITKRRQSLDDYSSTEKLVNNSYKRTSRLRNRITNIVSCPNALFLTFTFNDKTLDSTNVETRRKYVSKWLKLNCVSYVANIDYGKKNEREHYHACCNLINERCNLQSWLYGSLDYERIRTNQTTTPYKLSKYITKLTNHAIKETCKSNRLIYSRKERN